MDLMCQQSHIIINYLKNVTKENIDPFYLKDSPIAFTINNDGVYLKRFSRSPSVVIENQTHYLTDTGINKLIYPDWNDSTFTLGKQLSTIFNVRTNFWFNQPNEDKQKTFSQAIKDYYKKFTQYGFNDFNRVFQFINKESHSHNLYDEVKLLGFPPTVDVNSINLKNIKHQLCYANDFRNVNFDVFYSKKYYLEKIKTLPISIKEET